MIKFVKFFKAVAKPTSAVEADAVYIVPARDANKCLVYVANNTGTKLLQVTGEDNATDTEARRIAQEALDAAQQAALDAGSAKNLASHASSAANSAQSAASTATNEIEAIKQRLTVLEGKVP